ncbi:GNAT family N-acetyltransferase [Thermoplasmatales archaeon AK]|nr:GNAT family N-acetyltransferase [Thermoplasmatales archaeon AK]
MESWRWTYSGIYTEDFISNWIRENYSKTRLLQQIAMAQLRKDAFFLGAFDSSKLVGFIHFRVSGSTAELLRLYLKPDYTRSKIGSKLLEEAERLMDRSGVTECILYVHSSNNIGVSFYQKKGFFCKGNEGDDLIMVKKYRNQK